MTTVPVREGARQLRRRHSLRSTDLRYLNLQIVQPGTLDNLRLGMSNVDTINIRYVRLAAYLEYIMDMLVNPQVYIPATNNHRDWDLCKPTVLCLAMLLTYASVHRQSIQRLSHLPSD